MAGESGGMIMPSGRPTRYSDELGREICARIAEGESLRQICMEDGMPSRATVNGWLGNNTFPVFSANYATAQQIREDTLFDEIIDQGRETLENPTMEKNGASKVFLDSLKWSLARMNRSRFGERSAVDLGGQQGSEIRFSWKPAEDDAKE